MATDQSHEQIEGIAPQSPAAQDGVRLVAPSRSRRRGRVLSLIIVVLIAASGVWAAANFTSDDPVPQLTHILRRGDLSVTIIEQGLLESAENTEIKSKVRGRNTVLWIIESGTMVEKGDELIRLDSSFIEEQIDERTKYAHWSRSAAERSAANVARSELAVSEYDKGRYIAELMELEKELAVAEARLTSSQDRLSHTRMMAKSKYISELEVEEREFSVEQAKLNVDLMKTQLDVLKDFTRKEQLQTLKGNLKAAKANHEANAERAMADASRRDRALDEVQYCVMRAPRAGLVIHPNAAKWEFGPIEEGSNVHKDQILLLMPDLNQMQVKVGVREAVVKRVKEGQSARVVLPDRTTNGKVSSVASVTKPAGWWTGNEVRYDTMVALPNEAGLKPGMSAEVEIVIAEYQDVLQIPVAAIVETEDSAFCWVRTKQGVERRSLKLGDSNDVFTIVEDGVTEGEEVVLNPPSSGQNQ